MALFASSKYPKTAKYEADQKKLIADSARFTSYLGSDELKRVKELEILINSSDFKKKVDKLKNEKFKDTTEYRQLKKFQEQKKSSEFKKYFKFQASGMPERLKQIENSPKRDELSQLSELIRSSEFLSEKKQKGFKKTESYKKLKQFKTLSKDADIKLYNKQIKSAAYKNFLNIHDSERLKTYHGLEQEVTSEKFIEFKNWMEDKKKFHKSEEYSLIQEYNNLLKSPDYIWYVKTEKNNSFDLINKWELCFEDEFNSNQLDKNKWITGYYWGKALLNKTYVLENEKQFFNDNNISIDGSGASINTKNEETKGLVWDTQRGFMPKDFKYTSGIISTGQSHRQLYGKIEAKVKIQHSRPVSSAFWMVGESMAPQIDIFRFESKNAKTFKSGLQLLNGKGVELHSKDIKGANFESDYFVYSMEWSKNKIIWYINGVKVNEQNNNIPNQPMYLVFSSHITQEIDTLKSPASINVKWVKCYQKKK
ncbi:glycoside hydrolase family 16 protein [Carboxylicivirga marina]|uniref:Family 16 glycosylhydrolase n=1 Tax=Carboxylicivirga marina TaxID=2800988 RepID=A0ABS1HNF5_9BACT|nr:glycoside hydrolase family 16 protein [Carboxylicivirga marina]MBK3519219.1 family 16 glycosylhydrolase [Carboxylicivirga marina]